MNKRTVEVFSAGCPTCEDTVNLVRSLACPSCEVLVLDMHTGAAQEKAKGYGVRRVPAVVVDGKLAECCRGGAEVETLRSLGVGAGS